MSFLKIVLKPTCELIKRVTSSVSFYAKQNAEA